MPGKEKEPEMRETVGEQSREKRDRPGKLDNLTEREGWGKRGSNRKKKSRDGCEMAWVGQESKMG